MNQTNAAINQSGKPSFAATGTPSFATSGKPSTATFCVAMHGVGRTLTPQLISEIGDIRRYTKRSLLERFAGIEPQT